MYLLAQPLTDLLKLNLFKVLLVEALTGVINLTLLK